VSLTELVKPTAHPTPPPHARALRVRTLLEWCRKIFAIELQGDLAQWQSYRVFKDLHQIVFEYQDGNGQLRKEELNNTDLYQLQQRYAAGRASVASGS